MGLYVVSVSLKDSYYRYIQYLLYKLGHEFPSTADGGLFLYGYLSSFSRCILASRCLCL